MRTSWECRFEGLPFVKIMEGRVLVLHITPRERAALQLLADGRATNEIACGLGISEHAIEAHLSTLFARMGAASRTEAIAAAWRRGLLNGEQVARVASASG
jgi:DNA-binding CsgD family transcriptional regulator